MITLHHSKTASLGCTFFLLYVYIEIIHADSCAADAPSDAAGASTSGANADDTQTMRPAPSDTAQDQSGGPATPDATHPSAGDGAAADAAQDEACTLQRATAGGAAAEGSGSIPSGYICIPPPIDSESGVANIPSTESLIKKLREV